MTLLQAMIKSDHECFYRVSDKNKQADDTYRPAEMSSLCASFEAMIELVGEMITVYNENVNSEQSNYKVWSAVLVRLGSSINAMKSRGEETIIATYLVEVSIDKLQRYLKHWRDGCERLFRLMRRMLSWEGMGSGSSYVLTDSKCSGHLTGEK